MSTKRSTRSATRLSQSCARLALDRGADVARVGDIAITRHWLIPQTYRPKVYASHPVMCGDEIRTRTLAVWDRFYTVGRIWARSHCTPTLCTRGVGVVFKLYRQIYANTGIATDNAASIA